MSSSDSTVLFRRAPKSLDRKQVEKFAGNLRRCVTAGKPFLCLVSDDRELRRLNRTFLGKDSPTDVLSFPEEGETLGELAISGTRAAAQAAKFGHSLEQEIGILMLHGVLHLMGMDHENDHGRMRRVEVQWRRKLGLPAGLIERVRA
jgi:probable rRNA maturation factor